MAFLQGDQLSPVQGSAGQTQVVTPSASIATNVGTNVVNTVGSAIDTAGDIYGENKARELVESEIENIDRARAIAEQGEFTAGDAVPPSLKLDQKEWDIMATAVQSGTMSREKARLMASSRLRSRIAEEPFFADRMRKAASGLLGFNIESEAAQQYFSSFQTEAALAAGGSGAKTQEQKWMDLARAMESGNGIPADKIYRQIAAVEYGKYQKELLLQQRDAGAISDQQMFTEFNQKNSRVAFTGIIGTIRQVSQAQGSVKEEDITRVIEEAKAVEIAELTANWRGDQTSPEFARAQEVIEDRYQSYQTFANSVGYDKLQEIAINRNKNERTLFTDEHFKNVKMIDEVWGQAGVQAYFDSMNSNLTPTKRAQLFEQFPVLKQIHALANGDLEALSKQVATTSAKILTNGEFTEDDNKAVDAAATGLHDNGSDEVKTAVLENLRKRGMPYKALSIAARKAPRYTSVENIEYMKFALEKEAPQLLQQIGTLVAKSENLSTYVRQDGTVGIKLSAPAEGAPRASRRRQEDMAALEEANGLLAKLSVYSKAADNGWSTEFGMNKEQLNTRFAQTINDSAKNATTTMSIKALEEDQISFKSAVTKGDYEKGRELYEKLRSQNPQVFHQDYDTVYDRIREGRLSKEVR